MIFSICICLTNSSIIELNVSIMVACMPACASLCRCFISRFQPISSKKTRFSSQRSSNHHHRFSHSRASTMVASAGRPSGSYGDDNNAEKSNHWRIKNLCNSDAAPQITRNYQQSSVLKMGNFDVSDDRKEFAKPGHGSIDLREMSPDAKPFDMV